MYAYFLKKHFEKTVPVRQTLLSQSNKISIKQKYRNQLGVVMSTWALFSFKPNLGKLALFFSFFITLPQGFGSPKIKRAHRLNIGTSPLTRAANSCKMSPFLFVWMFNLQTTHVFPKQHHYKLPNLLSLF
jgi:hypothetical protein